MFDVFARTYYSGFIKDNTNRYAPSTIYDNISLAILYDILNSPLAGIVPLVLLPLIPVIRVCVKGVVIITNLCFYIIRATYHSDSYSEGVTQDPDILCNHKLPSGSWCRRSVEVGTVLTFTSGNWRNVPKLLIYLLLSCDTAFRLPPREPRQQTTQTSFSRLKIL